MKRIFGFFPSIFMLYFIFVHPAIIYYAGNDTKVTYPDKTYFYVSIALWAIIFLILLVLIYKISFAKKKYIENLLKSGTRLEGKIKSSTIKSLYPKNMETRDVLIELPNLKGEIIQHRMSIVDSKPWEKRYEKDNKIQLRVDPQLRNSPAIIIEGAKTRINYSLYLIWFLFLLGIAIYYYIVFQKEGNGQDWSFFGPWHPIIISAYCLFGFTSLFYFIFTKFIFRLSGKKQVQLKFKGRKTEAKLVNISETGTRINSQPVVRFEMEYTDHLGRTFKAEIKKVVSLLNLANANQPSKTIFYLEESPQTIAFEEELLESH